MNTKVNQSNILCLRLIYRCSGESLFGFYFGFYSEHHVHLEEIHLFQEATREQDKKQQRPHVDIVGVIMLN